MAYTMRNRASARPGFRSLAMGLLLWPALAFAAPVPPMADSIAVSVDQAKLVKLPGKVATIVVGNPLIADVTLQAGGIAMAAAGLFTKREVRVFDVKMTILPSVSPFGGGLSAFGTF